jgi:hypothetical protein
MPIIAAVYIILYYFSPICNTFFKKVDIFT